MQRLTPEIRHFFHNQGFVICSTIDRKGNPHSSCKGIVKIDENDKVYLLDLYRSKTYQNLRHNPRMSITAVNEHKFTGYCLKGKARIVREDKIESQTVREWEDKIIGRITQRVLRNISGEKGHPKHPEVLLPKPKYLIVIKIREVVDLTPHHLKEGV